MCSYKFSSNNIHGSKFAYKPKRIHKNLLFFLKVIRVEKPIRKMMVWPKLAGRDKTTLYTNGSLNESKNNLPNKQKEKKS